MPAGTTPAGTTPAGVDSGDWKYASLHYLDVNGRETDTADFGQIDAADGTGHWLIDTTQYDAAGNTVWQLSAGNRQQAESPTAETDTKVTDEATEAGRADLLAEATVYNPLDPAEATDTYGPAHPVTLEDGTLVHARVHVHTDYDEAAPNNDVNPAGLAYRLPTTVITSPFDIATQADVASSADTDIQHTGYAAVAGMAKSGWDLGLATTTTVQMGASPDAAKDLVTTTVYDADGRVIEQRLPGDATGDAAGTSPRTTKTTYYTATGTGGCVSGNAAGLVCKTAPGGQPGGAFAASPLATTVTVYNAYGSPTSSTETYTASGTDDASAPTRTTTSTYDGAQRTLTTSVATANVTGSQSVPTVTFGYDPNTGRQITQSTGSGAGQKTITTSYDPAGQVSSYTDATGAVTYTGYDIDGRPVSRVDAKGASTWTYDGNGSEHRGLVTLERHANRPVSTDTLGSGGTTDVDGNLDLTGSAGAFGFTVNYTASGDQATQGYPNGLSATTRYVNAGNTTSLTYTKASTTWMTFTQTNGTGERTIAQSATVNGQPASSQAFDYDHAGRLTTVQDTTGPAVTGNGSTTCETRGYQFDQHSNRTKLTTNPAGAGGACSTTTTATTVTSTYDAADRITGSSNTNAGSYSYDVTGRTLTVPGSDATGTGSHATASGQLSLGYYDNDLAASQTQGTGSTKQVVTFGLDVQQDRFATQATAVGDSSPVTTTVTNHYDGSSDTPAWADNATGGSSSTWQVFVVGPDGNLAATVDQTGAGTLQLCNPHGDIVATTPATGSANSIADYTEATEYGAPRNTATAKATYGWVGGKQRSSDAVGGIVLMGVRLYNPSTGRFLSVDPVAGGNANAYVYPSDPVNAYDLNGQWGCSWCKKAASRAAKGLATVSQYSGYIPSAFCEVCGAISAATGYASAGFYLASGNKKAAAKQAISTSIGVVLGTASRSLGSAARSAGSGKVYTSYWEAKVNGVGGYAGSQAANSYADHYGRKRSEPFLDLVHSRHSHIPRLGTARTAGRTSNGRRIHHWIVGRVNRHRVRASSDPRRQRNGRRPVGDDRGGRPSDRHAWTPDPGILTAPLKGQRRHWQRPDSRSGD